MKTHVRVRIHIMCGNAVRAAYWDPSQGLRIQRATFEGFGEGVGGFLGFRFRALTAVLDVEVLLNV